MSKNQQHEFSPLDGIILSNFTTYAKLDPMIIQAFPRCPDATEVGIFIDLYPILKSCYKYTGTITDATCLASNIISMCVHYREFFRRKGVSSTFYIINALNCSQDNAILVPGYNDSMVQLVNARNNEKFILNNLKILKDICPYLPDIHFLSSPIFESSVLMAAVITKLQLMGIEVPYLIISKDLYPLSLIGEFKNIAQLIPKKVKENGKLADGSEIVNGDPIGFWNWYIKKREIQFSDLVKLGPQYYSMINALTRFPERNVKSMFPLNKTLEAFNRLILEGVITPMVPPSMFYLKPILERTFPSINTSTVQLRYNALSIPGPLHSFMQSADYGLLEFTNQYNPEIVRNFNNVLFSNNPIEIDKL